MPVNHCSDIELNWLDDIIVKLWKVVGFFLCCEPADASVHRLREIMGVG